MTLISFLLYSFLALILFIAWWDYASCGKELKYSGNEGAHLWQIVHLLNHLLAEVSDLVEVFGPRKDGDPGWVLHYIESHLREIAEAR